jgi:hypothetical protein
MVYVFYIGASGLLLLAITILFLLVRLDQQDGVDGLSMWDFSGGSKKQPL